MITIICATHRPKNQTQRIVSYYRTMLEQLGQEVKVLEMTELPRDFVFADSFGARTGTTQELLQEKLIPAERVVVISPEYQGSYPGVFKAFLDGIEPSLWKGKKVALVGVASGRGGNLRGLDHLTGVLHYLRAEVFSQKVPISSLDKMLDERGQLVDQKTQDVLREQAEAFLAF